MFLGVRCICAAGSRVFLRHMRVVLPKSCITAFCRSVRHAGVCIRPQPSRNSLARPRPPWILPACFSSHLATQHAAGRTCLKEPQGCLCCFCDFRMHVGQPQLSSKERNKNSETNTFSTCIQECHEICESGEYVYLDVRTSEEFQASSPTVKGTIVLQ